MTLRKILSREFILCFFAQFAFTSVFHVLVPTIPIYLSRLGSTEVEIGILIGNLRYLFPGPQAGDWEDTFKNP